jgi:glucose-6-phosphate isomerase
MEGYRDKFVWFFRCRSVEESGVALNRTHFVGQDLLVGRGMGDLLAAEADATREAFEHSGVPSLTLRLEALGEKELGALFMLLELVVGAIGEAHDINAFDQPGVELGKRLARAKLANQQL